ncbi:hypothetical protein [Aeromicrobium sp. IC_218]|uniref:hypothetical protein n=1 Tax=Aeromicrobium sp. IC_218 TaxID=2545468 RepID=UPI00103C72FA|nr:hypothetical protein [Aeromicrobium sp. IC_218]TCI95945.1 hypothetical protein E0W78_15590 [Aeromicrobium sp. IC_218]
MSSATISAITCTVLAVVVLAAGPWGALGSVFLLACAAYRWHEVHPGRPVVRVRGRHGVHG